MNKTKHPHNIVTSLKAFKIVNKIAKQILASKNIYEFIKDWTMRVKPLVDL